MEYVIVHELCNLVHNYHKQNFIDLKNKEPSDWKRQTESLEKSWRKNKINLYP
ncbi:YgjP-like metallopeptidase domain-containing protein [Paradesertivirga mongoliensis]|uniref:YgjP-like metallopeptidase domain-containing protein n=1 Tax=Paradesertivirga mongoliensis TaxID=2100740 RepID=A0ABW4ZM45_9SPHI